MDTVSQFDTLLCSQLFDREQVDVMRDACSSALTLYDIMKVRIGTRAATKNNVAPVNAAGVGEARFGKSQKEHRYEQIRFAAIKIIVASCSHDRSFHADASGFQRHVVELLGVGWKWSGTA